MATTNIVDQTVFERVIRGFREKEFYFVGFETQSVDRQSNLLTWVVKRTYHEKQATDKSTRGKLGDETAVIVYFNRIWDMEKNDDLTLTYKLTWWWKGGGDDPVRLPFPTPGATLCFETIAA